MRNPIRTVRTLLLSAAAGLLLAGTAAAEVDTIDIPQLEGMVAANHGKVTIVNFWATWCPPCTKEFPDFIKLYDEYRDKGLEVVAISMNEPDELEDIAEFMQEHQPTFKVYRAASVDEEFYAGISDDWMGILPLTLIFDTNGKTAFYHLKEVNYDGLKEDITPLLP